MERFGRIDVVLNNAGYGLLVNFEELTTQDFERQFFDDFTVARITDMPAFDVHLVPSADAPTGMGEPGLPPLAPAFANAIARLTGKPLRRLPFNLA